MYHFSQKLIVSDDMTAAHVGSGFLSVYATPSVVALMENTACALITSLPSDVEGALLDGETTVGTHMEVDHVKACLPGEEVVAEAFLRSVEGRQYTFEIKVLNAVGELLASAYHTRFRVNAERFMAKLKK